MIAERIGRPNSMPPLRKRLAQIRPEYVGIDPVDRTTYAPGQITQCDLWFAGFSQFLTATVIPSRQAGDILAGMWMNIAGIGRVTQTLVWDRESAIGGTGRVSAPAAVFAGTLATRILLPAKGRGVQGHGRAEQRLSGDELPARPVLRLAGRSTSSSQTGC